MMRSKSILLLMMVFPVMVLPQAGTQSSVQDIVQRSMAERQKMEEKLKLGIVRVEAQKEVKEVGTGFVISSSPDKVWILTALHVVRDAKSINLFFYSNQTTPVPAHKLTEHSENLDLALLEVRPSATVKVPNDLPVYNFAANSTLQAGEQMWSVNGEWVQVPNSITRLSHNRDPQKFEYSNISGGRRVLRQAPSSTATPILLACTMP